MFSILSSDYNSSTAMHINEVERILRDSIDGKEKQYEVKPDVNMLKSLHRELSEITYLSFAES